MMLITLGNSYIIANAADDPQTNSPLVFTIVIAATATSGTLASSNATSTTSSPNSASASSRVTQPANITLYITIGIGVAGAGIIVAATLMCLRHQRRLASSEESAPFIEKKSTGSSKGKTSNVKLYSIARSSKTASISSSTSATGGFFAKSTHTDASYGQFSDVQGDQSNTRIHTINYNFIGDTSRAATNDSPS